MLKMAASTIVPAQSPPTSQVHDSLSPPIPVSPLFTGGYLPPTNSLSGFQPPVE
ncbi:hypothetical protein D3C86_2101690 [compost metagenome]